MPQMSLSRNQRIRSARCKKLALVPGFKVVGTSPDFSHLADGNAIHSENCKTTGERWPRTSLPFILPSQHPAKSSAKPTPLYKKRKSPEIARRRLCKWQICSHFWKSCQQPPSQRHRNFFNKPNHIHPDRRRCFYLAIKKSVKTCRRATSTLRKFKAGICVQSRPLPSSQGV
jgi:hypothetical protein